MSYVMLLCLCGCGTDPGTPLLSFPMVVPSQEQMTLPATYIPLLEKSAIFPGLLLGPSAPPRGRV